MFLNFFLIMLIIIAVGCGAFFYYKKIKKEVWEGESENEYALKYITQTISETFAATLKQNLKELNLSRVELEKKDKLKTELRDALHESTRGDKDAKVFIKKYIRDILQQGIIKITPQNIDKVIHFNSSHSLKVMDKFEIALHIYNKEYGQKGFKQMVYDYKILNPKLKDNGAEYYDFSIEDIEKIYEDKISEYSLTFDDKLDILAQRIFENYKGFGPIDMLRETDIDEIDCGVSGIPMDSYEIKLTGEEPPEFSYDSIWVMLSGVNLKMSCLTFGTQEELVRVCQNVYKYNASHSLSRRNGNVVSTMKDGSRIVVCRPPFAESWCFFLRKFDSCDAIAPESLLRDENNIIPITLMKWFIRGYRTMAITGGQGSGKTTTLKSLIRFIPEDLNLRVQEMAFELNLRYTYPKRNIVTFQETESISSQDGLNIQKKTNGSVNVIGEVATAEAASWIIQTAKVASLFTMFTHHAKTSEDLVVAVRNNLLETGGYNNEKAAEEMVAEVINIDMHMTKLQDRRFCERITEIVPIHDRRYPSEKEVVEMADINDVLAKDTIEYQKRITDRQLFQTVNLCEWHDGKYVMKHMPTDYTINDIKMKLANDILIKEFEEDMEMLRGMIEV